MNRTATGLVAVLMSIVLAVIGLTASAQAPATEKVQQAQDGPGNVDMLTWVTMNKEGADILGVRKEYLDAAFDEMEKNYGTIEKYFSEGLGINAKQQQALKDLYLSQETADKPNE
jgi:protein tyrosine/serine phosphatase